jgi:hypothetical protein
MSKLHPMRKPPTGAAHLPTGLAAVPFLATAGLPAACPPGACPPATILHAARALVALGLAVGLAACGNKPVPPDWTLNAKAAVEGANASYLKGNAKAADAEFGYARREIARTGRPDLLARAELVRCAARVASLDFDPCTGYAALAQDAAPAEQAYAAYLEGRWQELEASRLPPQHQAIVQGKGQLEAIEEPLARLVAAGVLLRSGRITPAQILLAVDTASAQGWRRPLLAWLGVQHKRALDAGDTAAAAALARRIELAASGQDG